MKRLLAVTALSVSGLVIVPSAHSDDTICTSVLVGGTFDNVVVPPGALCRLVSATVNGNVTAFENAEVIIDSSTVLGNVTGDKANVVDVFDWDVTPGASFVGGNIHAQGGSGYARVCGTTLSNGNIQVEKFGPNTDIVIGGDSCTFFGFGNTLLKGSVKVEETSIFVDNFEIVGNYIAQNLQVFKNIGSGTKVVTGNTVGGDLQCFENEGPFISFGNSAGQAQGQCL